MATARDIVTRAMKDRKVIGVNATPTASELSYGLDKLNDMLFFWETDGIPLGHITLAADDALDVPDDHLQTISLSLAERLTAFADNLDPEDKRQAFDGRQRLQALYFNLPDLSFETAQTRDNLARE